MDRFLNSNPTLLNKKTEGEFGNISGNIDDEEEIDFEQSSSNTK
jgi:hypothetical protein